MPADGGGHAQTAKAGPFRALRVLPGLSRLGVAVGERLKCAVTVCAGIHIYIYIQYVYGLLRKPSPLYPLKELPSEAWPPYLDFDGKPTLKYRL